MSNNKKYDLSKTEDLVKRLQEIRDKQQEYAQLYRKAGDKNIANSFEQSHKTYQMVIDEIRHVTYGAPGNENYL